MNQKAITWHIVTGLTRWLNEVLPD